MNCSFDKEKLTGYYDGELESAEKAEVERHIASCSECLRELGELKSAALLVKELPRLRAPRSIAEGVAREIQAAGKVHQFAKVRRTVLWACAAAAAVLVAFNVVYFVQADKAPVAAERALAGKAATPAPSIANAVPKAAEPLSGAPSDPAARRKSADRGDEQAEGALREEGRKKMPADADKKVEAKRAEVVKEEPAPFKDKDKLSGAPEAKPAPAPPAAVLPAAPPKPAAPVTAPAPTAKDDSRAAEAPVEKAGAAKKDAEPLPKQEADAKKRSVEVPAEPPQAHLTLVSTQMAKDRATLEASLKKMGVTLSTPPQAAAMKGLSRGREESTIALELSDRQIARLQQELTKAGRTQLIYASPGDPVLQQYGDAGMLKGKTQVASGGAAAPTARKPAEAPKADAAKAGESKEAEEQAPRPEAERGMDKANEPKRKIVLHLMEVTFMPDPQPAADPVKK